MCNHDDYEFYDDWLNQEDDEYNISLDEYNEMRCIEEYVDDSCYDDDDSNDPS